MTGRGWKGSRWGWVLGLVLLAGAAQARVVAGVRMPERIQLQGRVLALEHMALKEKLFLDLYVWGLYLERSPRSAREAIAFEGLKRLRFQFKRAIQRDQLVDAFSGFLASSVALRAPEMRKHTESLVHSLRGVSEGDGLDITYYPGQGLEISGEGSKGAFIPGKAFADALFTAWLSENPIYQGP